MSLFKRFVFWLPLLTVVHYIYELLFNPIKDIVLAIDPVLSYLFRLFGGTMYDYENYSILFYGFLLHFILWFIYGFIIDRFIKNLALPNILGKGDKRNDSYY